MQFFQELGALVEARWRDRNYDEGALPDIAAEALDETAPSKHVDPWDIIQWVNKTPQLPEQRDLEGRFGNPPITLYNSPRFYIDVYYWLDGTTSIHQHAFCGAFQVLLGSSILSQYDFNEERRINAHFSIGQIILNNVELLSIGDTRRILPGKQYIHSLFHLDRPSATIIIRTYQSQIGLPQYNYYKPHFAADPFFRDPAMIKRIQSAGLLLQMNHPQADELIGEALSISDFQTAFSLLDLVFNTHNHLEKAFGLSPGHRQFESLLEIARRRHGKLVDLIPAVLGEVQRQQNVIQRRAQITSNDHRFFLALLLNIPSRVRILDLVAQRFPEDNPVSTIMNWVEELGNTRMAGSSEPNVLGIADFDDDYMFVLQGLFEGLTLEELRMAAAEEYSADDSERLDSRFTTLYDSIRRSSLFNTIFRDAKSPVAVGA